MDEGGLIGKEQQTAGVFIEATDAGDLRIARAPTGREETVDVGAFAFVVGTDQAEGLVEKQEKTVGMIERLTLDEDIGRRDLGTRIVGDFTAHGDAAGVDPVARLAARTVAKIGEELIETTHQDEWRSSE
jgi:hypothetical protein